MYNPTAHPVTLWHLDPEGHVRDRPGHHSRIQLTPGPQGKSDEEEDWGEWKSDGRRAHGDQRRPRSPSLPPAQVSPSENRIVLIPLSVRQHVPDFGSHRFKLRTGCRVEDLNDVLYYTLPSIAALEFPEPEQWKKSWETVYRSLMTQRRSIIEDEQRVKSISEFPFSPPPHGVPGRWTHRVVRDISDYFQISPKSLPQQLIVQLGICEEKWPYISRTARTYHHFSTDKKNSQKNLFGIIFSFEPRRLLPDKHRTQSQSTFFWSHNTNMQAAMNILRDEELIRPSKFPPTASAQTGTKSGCLRWDFTAGAAFNLKKRQSNQPRSSREFARIAPCALVGLRVSGNSIAPYPVAECTLT